MSWSRWGVDSSVYTYPSSRGGECCGCSLIPGGFTTTDVGAFLTHLDEHRAAGQLVPDYTYESVRAEWAEFSDEWRP